MGFNQKEAEALLAATGRRCCICGSLHNIQLHHIIVTEEGGTDDIDNAIPLCPNCHDEVHGRYASGRTTRSYTANELKLHRQRTVELVNKQRTWAPGNPLWEEDKNLILFYTQCLDRPAFRRHFHEEMSFSAFDKAMEDTLVALNTGYWRTRDGALIERAKGKVHVVHTPWHEKVEHIVEIIEEIRTRFKEAVGFSRRLYELDRGYPNDFEFDKRMDRRFRRDRDLGEWMDTQRQEAIETMNSILQEIGHQPLRGINKWQ
ncbi:MAG: HNH endonuclease [Anaerolineae bacterium]|nr:HNH endonuclease [Anaerolineae bacterium]